MCPSSAIGNTVSVVNSYAAASDAVCVALLSSVDFESENENFADKIFLEWTDTFPTEGNPIKATRASPDFCTSKPVPAAPDFAVGSSSWARYRASLALRRPRWYSVAYLYGYRMMDFFTQEARYLVLLGYSRVNETSVFEIRYSSKIAHCGPSPLITRELSQRRTETGKGLCAPSISLI